MEPVELNNPGADDSIERLLHGSMERVEDRDFSARVLAAVNAKRRHARIRLGAMLAGGATGLAVAASAGAFGAATAQFSFDLQRSFAAVFALAANPAVIIAALCIAAALVYVFRRDASGSPRP